MITSAIHRPDHYPPMSRRPALSATVSMNRLPSPPTRYQNRHHRQPHRTALQRSRENVVPFRPGDPRSPALTPVENSAFNELARQLSARPESETGLITSTNTPEADSETDDAPTPAQTLSQPAEAASQAAWLTTPPAAPRGEMMRDKVLLDLMPVGVLIYRLDRLLFANPAFLARMNYPSLNALEEAGGLDALYVGADVSSAASTSDDGTAVTISGGDQSGNTVPAEARLYTISWDNEPAHALISLRPRQSLSPPLLRSLRPLRTRPARRPYRCRRSGHHPRYHGRRHHDVRRRRQHQFRPTAAPKHCSAIDGENCDAAQSDRPVRARKPARRGAELSRKPSRLPAWPA